MYSKLVPVHYISFTLKYIKIYLESIAPIYHLCIYLQSSLKVLSTTWTSHWTTGSSVKPLISGAPFSENAS